MVSRAMKHNSHLLGAFIVLLGTLTALLIVVENDISPHSTKAVAMIGDTLVFTDAGGTHFQHGGASDPDLRSVVCPQPPTH